MNELLNLAIYSQATNYMRTLRNSLGTIYSLEIRLCEFFTIHIIEQKVMKK